VIPSKTQSRVSQTPVPQVVSSESGGSRLGTSYLSCLSCGATHRPSSRVDRPISATAPPACEAKQKRSQSTHTTNPLLKRIAQTDLGQVAQSWQNLCEASGGPRDPNNDPCVVLAGINGINALLANADACAQQDNADAMVDFAKLPGVNNEQALIDNAVAYRKHPRNALNINGVVPSTLFCENAPRNPELNGLVNGQLDGVDPGLFGSPSTGVVAFGARE
jgi:hypothetical protein